MESGDDTIMAEYTTQGQGTLNTVLGALGTAAFTGIGNGNGLSLFGNNKDYATKSDLDNAIIIANKDSEIALLKANSDSERLVNDKIISTYKEIMAKVNDNKAYQDAWNSEQLLSNCKMSNAISLNAQSIAVLEAMTKTVIPITNVCPQPAVATTTSSTNTGTGGGAT